jgi:hypothetical protein
VKHSNFSTPRNLSEGSFSVGYQQARSTGTRVFVRGWLGWIAFCVLLLVNLSGRV